MLQVSLREETCTVFEKDGTLGGLCGGFSVEEFHFDKAVHLSFAKEPLCQELFFSVPHEVHQPESTNYKSGYWVRHPAQNNLRTLPVEERIRIIEGFAARQYIEAGDAVKVENYRDWLRLQFGDYFSEHYPEVYTRKYWGTRAERLSTTWCSGRIYQSSLREVLFGSYPDADQSANVYYAKEMRYPKHGAYRAFVQQRQTNWISAMDGKSVQSIRRRRSFISLMANSMHTTSSSARCRSGNHAARLR